MEKGKKKEGNMKSTGLQLYCSLTVGWSAVLHYKLQVNANVDEDYALAKAKSVYLGAVSGPILFPLYLAITIQNLARMENKTAAFKTNVDKAVNFVVKWAPPMYIVTSAMFGAYFAVECKDFKISLIFDKYCIGCSKQIVGVCRNHVSFDSLNTVVKKLLKQIVNGSVSSVLFAPLYIAMYMYVVYG
jgi:hypothetical protein